MIHVTVEVVPRLLQLMARTNGPRRDCLSGAVAFSGYVPFGQLEDYTGGRSNGCTSWSPSDAGQIIAMVKDDPTTLYIYPESADIDAVTQAAKAGQSLSRAGLYWNASCLKEIGSPKFWSKKALEPGPCQIQQGSSGAAATATADLQRAVKLSPFLVSCIP